jgi:amino acid transporter
MGSLVLLVSGGTKMIGHLGLVFFAVVLLTCLVYYISLFGAPNLEAADAHHTEFEANGLSSENLRNNWGPDYSSKYPFSECLAVFFPCFTGILSGANRAATLQDPATAIPRGTLGAICISYVMYMTMLILWAAVGERAYLKMDHGQIDSLLWPSLKAAQIGIVFSSLGQALQCIVVAPRLLASIANDGMLKVLNPLAVMTAGEPKRALILVWAVGGAVVLIGDLNMVAPLLSCCFLMCYAFMNFNVFVLDAMKDPHWRPRWKYFHWSIGLAGFLLCTALMFIINWIYAIIAWVGTGLLLAWIVRSNVQTDWGSALQGLRFTLAVRALKSIDMESHLDQNWKPQLLLLYQLREDEEMDTTQDGHADVHLEGGSSSAGGSEEGPGHTHELMFSVAEHSRADHSRRQHSSMA